MVVKYACLLNGVTGICLTKLDVLDTFPEIKIGVSYKYQGKDLPSMPGMPMLFALKILPISSANQTILGALEVQYITVPGWEQDISVGVVDRDHPFSHAAESEILRRFAQERPSLREESGRARRCARYDHVISRILMDITVKWIGVGPGRDEMIHIE